LVQRTPLKTDAHARFGLHRLLKNMELREQSMAMSVIVVIQMEMEMDHGVIQQIQTPDGNIVSLIALVSGLHLVYHLHCFM
jgi:hypothetical protein